MRESLTALSILLIGVLTAALVGPYLVDWDAHRDLIARELSRVAGAPVAIAGHVDLKLLPTPRLRADGISVGDGASNSPHLSADAVEVELSAAALMRGQVQVVEALLVRPRLDLVEEPGGAFGPADPSTAMRRLAVDHLIVRDGQITLTTAAGRRIHLADLDFDGDATTLRGPFKAAGRAGPTPFHLATGSLDGGRLRVRLHAGGEDAAPTVDVDGLAAFRPDEGGPRFTGSAVVAGRLVVPNDPATVPWRLAGQLSADRDGVVGSGLELRAGVEDRALIASGDASADYGRGDSRPHVALRLRGSGLDVDRLAVEPDGSGFAPPSGLDMLRLLAAAGRAVRPTSLPFAIDASARFDTVTVSGRTLPGAEAALSFDGRPSVALRAAVDGPDGSRIALDGRAEPSPPRTSSAPFGAGPADGGAWFQGRAEVRSRDLRRSAAWLRPIAPTLAAGLAALPGRSLAARAEVDLSPSNAAARAVEIDLDGSSLSGTASFSPGVGASAPRLSADLSTAALDLAALPDLSALVAAPLDLDLALSADAVTVANADVVGLPSIAAARVSGHILKSGDRVTLDRATMEVDGASIEGTASRDRAGARASARVAAVRLGPLAATLSRLLPTPWAAALRSRAAALSPLDATVRLVARIADAGMLAPTEVSISGEAGGTSVDLALVPDTPASSVAAQPTGLVLRAAAPDGTSFLRQLGFPASGPSLGAARLEIRGHGAAATGFDGRVEGTIGAARVIVAGRVVDGQADGRATLDAPDIGPLFSAAGLLPAGTAVPAAGSADVRWDGSVIALRAVSTHVGASTVQGEVSFAPRATASEPALRGRLTIDRLSASTLLGPALGGSDTSAAAGTWSRAPFGPPTVVLPPTEIALTINDMPLDLPIPAPAAKAVSATFHAGPGTLSLREVAAELERGRLGGDLSLRRDGSGVSASGRLTWSGTPVALAGLSARSSGQLELAGSAASPAALISALAGTGLTSLSDATQAHTDPAAPGRVLARIAARDAAAERGSAAPAPTVADPGAVGRDIVAALEGGPLSIGDPVGAPMTLAAGVLHVGPLRSSGDAAIAPSPAGAPAPVHWTAETSVALDLASLSASSRTTLLDRADRPSTDGGSAGEVTISEMGPVRGPLHREVDASALVEAVQAAAIVRAQERIDVVEQDIRERAAFERQRKALEALRRAEQERAESERRDAHAALEASRAEAARRKAEDDRVQADVAAAARAAAEKPRPADRAPAPLDLGRRVAPGDRAREAAPRAGLGDAPEPVPPSAAVDEGR